MPAHSTGRSGHPARHDRWVAVASVLVMALTAGVLAAALRHDLTTPTTSPGSGSAAGTTVKTGTTDRHRTRPTTPRRGQAVARAHGRDQAVPRAHWRGEAAQAHWRRILARLDRWRARAYATAQPGPLRRVYTAQSPMLRRDRALLLQYRRRGLHVEGMRMRVLDLKVRARRREPVVLVVRERLGAAIARGGGRPRRIQADDVDRHVIALRRGTDGAWRIASVR